MTACGDDDTITGTAGSSGSGGTAGSGGSGGGGGSAGNAGSAGSAGSAGTGGAGGSSGSGGSAGSAGSAGDPDGGTDGGDAAVVVPAIVGICTDLCAAKTTFATSSVSAPDAGDAGSDASVAACPGFDSAGCQAACVGENGSIPPPCQSAHSAMLECFTSENTWTCATSSTVLQTGCGAAEGALGLCFSQL